MTRLATGFLVGAPVWLAIGVYIGLRLVWAEEPETTYAVPEDGVQPVDPYLIPYFEWTPPKPAGCQCPPLWYGTVPPPCPIHNPQPLTFTTTDTNTWATDPHLTTLTEGGKHP